MTRASRDVATDSYSHGADPRPLIGQTIGDNLAATAALFPSREALVSCHQGLRYTYAEFDRYVDVLAGGLLGLGLRPGDRIGIWSPNYAEWAVTQYATARAGLILVNINPAYRIHELEYVLRQSDCRALISAPSYKSSDYEAMVKEIRGSVPGLQHVLFLWSEDWDALLLSGKTFPSGRLREISEGLSFDDPINIQYTSGTTGFPKGATLSHHNILNNGFFVGEGCRYTEVDRVCIPVPFYHCFGMVLGNLACTSHGAAIVLPAATFEPRAVLTAVQAEKCTSLYGVPSMFIAELAEPEFEQFDLSSLRTGIMAGAPCPVEVMKRAMESMHMAELTICYGMTETSPVSTQTGADDDIDRRVQSVGKVHPHVEVKVTSDEGHVLPRGETGELLTRGYSVMLGYWSEPERTAEAIDAARWMHTGDLATMDSEGYLSIVGRISDMVIRGGENVYPREVEEFLFRHPEIVDAQVVGIPDDRFGEEIVAWVKLRPGVHIEPEEIRKFCKQNVAHFKVPKHVFFTDEFPMTVSGKIQKFRLREMALDQLGLSQNINE